MRILALLTVCIAAVAAVPTNPQRIMGGSLTTIAQYPSISSLLYSWNSAAYVQACGGVIINNRSILTAAHCPIGDLASRWRIRVGAVTVSSGGVLHTVSQVIIHPSYSASNLDSDIAVLRSATTIAFNVNVAAASIAGSNYFLGDNQVVWAAGWGGTSQGGSSSEQLRHVQIWTVNSVVCAQRYAAIGATVTDNMLCSGWLDVGGRGQCQGDAGSPLYHNGVVVGVFSWGEGCGQAFFPGVNARVSRFNTWIQSAA